MTHIQPNLTSNLPAVSRVDIVARQNPAPKRGVAVYSDTARTRSMEDAMLAAMAKVDGKVDVSTPDNLRNAMAAKDVLDALDKPATAKQIAEHLGKSEAGVLRMLSRLQTKRHVDVVGTTKTRARIWGRTEKAFVPRPARPHIEASIAKGQAYRSQVLSLIAKPMTGYQVAAETSKTHSHAMATLRALVKDGLATHTREGKSAGLFHAVAK